MSTLAGLTTNPYVGPRTFTRQESDLFFGRDREARNLLSLIISERLVLFYAESGAGKSSLINARLIPQLVEKEGFIALPVGRVSGELPPGIDDVDNIFAFNLMLSLDQSQQAPQRFTHMALTDFLAHLTTTDGEYYYYDADLDEEAEADTEYEEPPHILIIDQFEEIVTTHLNRWQDREGFLQQLNQAMLDDPLLWVLLTLREDNVAALRPYARIMENNMRARFYMKRMEATAARQAIERPAELAGRPFATGVSTTLVDNLRQIRVPGTEETEPGQFVEPVQLQVVCYQLWENLKARPRQTEITQQDVDELGDVDQALSEFYEQAIAKSLRETGVSEIALRNWFDRQLITEAETRGIVYQGEEESAGLDNDVVRVLADQFLLRAEIRAGGTWYELVHDRFVSPILQANQAWRLQQSPLIRAAEEWDRSGRSRDQLYRDQQLQEALASVDRETAEPLVQEFLTASEDAQSQRDLAEAQAQAAKQARRAEAEARTARRLRWLTVALVVAILIAAGLAVSALSQRDEAQAQRNVAEENADMASTSEAEARANSNLAATNEAEAIANAVSAATSEAEAQTNARLAATRAAEARANASLAATRQAEALTSQARAEELSQISLAQSLAAQAFRIANLNHNYQLAALLSVEALRLNDESNGNALGLIDSSLRESVSGPYFSSILWSETQEIEAAALSPDGQRLAFFLSGTGMQFLDLSDPSSTPTPLAGEIAAADKVAFDPGGTTLAVLSLDGLYLWDLENQDAPPLVLNGADNDDSGFVDFGFNDDGSTLLTVDDTDTVRAWDVTAVLAGEDVTPSQVVGARQNNDFLAFSPDGTILVTTSGNTVNLWDLTTPAATLDMFLAGGNATVIWAVFSPDQQFLASTDSEGEVRLWNLPAFRRGQGTPIQLNPGGELVTAMTFSADGRQLVTGHEDGTIQVWNWQEAGTEPVLLQGHRRAVGFVDFVGTEKRLVSIGGENSIRHWDPSVSGINTILRQGESLGAFHLSPGGQRLAQVQDEGLIQVEDLSDETAQPRRLEWQGGADELAFSADGQIMAAASSSSATIAIWDVSAADDDPLLLNSELNGVGALALSPDGALLAAGRRDGAEVHIWNLTAPETPAYVLPESLLASSVASGPEIMRFSSDGRTLALADAAGTVHLWHTTAPGEAPQPMTAADQLPSSPAAPVSSLSFSRDTSRLAAGSYNGTVYIWQLDDPAARPLSFQTGTTAQPILVAFGPDGDTLASTSGGTAISLWRLPALTANAEAPPVQLDGHEAPVRDVTFSRDGLYVISAGADGTVRSWVAEIDLLVDEACQLVLRNLAWDEWQRYLGMQPYRPTCPSLPVPPSVPDSG